MELRSTIKPTDENTRGATASSVGSAADSSMTGTGVETDSGLVGGAGVPALLKVAESYVQLLTPTRDDSTVAKWLANRGGPGIHHVGYRVADCAVALEAVKAQGFRVLDDAPRPGSRGTTVAFIHPKDALGTLIELVQE